VNGSSDTVLDRARVREVTGVFQSRDALSQTANALLLAGFDRADIDVVGSLDEIRRRLGVYVAPQELADVKHAPRRPFIAPEDITLTVAITAGVLAAAAAMAAAYVVLASSGGGLRAGLAAVVAGAVGGAIGLVATARLLRRDGNALRDPETAAHGLILWVRVRSDESAKKAQEILSAHGAEAVRPHEIEIEKRAQDLPFGSIRPDPWLGPERLGEP
jgi:hypothetical protein